MRAPLATWFGALALALALGVPPASAASPPGPEAPGIPLRPGTEVTTRIPALAPGAHEFELVLVPESGPAIAVSPELPAGVRVVRWRVPGIGAGRVRLVVRSGGAHDEWTSEPSAAFALEPLAPADDWSLRAGTSAQTAWRGTGAPLPDAMRANTGRASYAAALSAPFAAPAPETPAVVPPACVVSRACPLEPGAALEPVARPASPARIFTPMRN